MSSMLESAAQPTQGVEGHQETELSGMEELLVKVENTLHLGAPKLPEMKWDQELHAHMERSLEQTQEIGDGAFEAVGLGKHEGASPAQENGGHLHPVQIEAHRLASWTQEQAAEHTARARQLVEGASMDSLAGGLTEAARVAHETSKAGNRLIIKAGTGLAAEARLLAQRILGIKSDGTEDGERANGEGAVLSASQSAEQGDPEETEVKVKLMSSIHEPGVVVEVRMATHPSYKIRSVYNPWVIQFEDNIYSLAQVENLLFLSQDGLFPEEDHAVAGRTHSAPQ